MNCLDFVKGTCCPHFDEESNREPYTNQLLFDSSIDSCVSIEGQCAIHIVDGNIYKSINFGNKKNTYLLTYDGTRINKTTIDSSDL